MFKEFLEYLSKQAVKAASTKVVKPPGEPAHVYWLDDRQNGLKQCVAEPTPRNHQASNLKTIIDLAKDFGLNSDGEQSVDDNGSAINETVVWYNRNKIVLIANDETRRDRVTFNLAISPQLQFLMALEKNKPAWKQAALVLHLRTTLRDCQSACSSFIETIRRLKWTSGEDGGATVQHGKMSVGRSITAQLTGEGNIPEYVVFDTPIFEKGFPEIIGHIECAVEPQPDTQQIQLIPVAGGIERAICDAENRIGARLAEEVAPLSVYCGEP
jgi:hypothetical protein